jgi:outer membrane protein OmpA-like peptidoglycan-associated protein
MRAGTVRGRRAIAVAMGAAILSGGCGLRTRLSPAAPDTVVLLAEPGTGSVGRAVVSNSSGSVNLAADREYTRVAAGEAPARTAIMSEADVARIFGDALAAQPLAPQYFDLYFRFESDELTPESAASLDKILTAVRQRPVPEVVAIGHTDTMGSSASNFALGMRRAMTLRRLLIDAGLDPALIDVMSLGEADPVVPTPDETPEPRNRRVEVAIR